MKKFEITNGCLTEYSGTEESLMLPSNVTVIDDEAFNNCFELKNIELPEGLRSIGAATFMDCGLTTIQFPESLEGIGKEAFQNCTNLTDVTIPASVKSIGSGAFSYCSNIHAINVDESNPCYTSINGTAYNKDITEIVAVPSGKTGVFKIPESVKRIGDQSFCGCTHLNKIELNNYVTYIGDGAFQGCNALSVINIPSGVEYIGDIAFFECFELKEIHIPKGVTVIGERTFGFCGKLTNITIPHGVVIIEQYAFFDCSSLPCITLPESTHAIKEGAFKWCRGLLMIVIPSSVTIIEKNAFSGCNNLTVIKLYPDDPVFKRNYAIIPNLEDNIVKGLEMIRTGNYNMELDITIKTVFSMLHFLRCHDEKVSKFIQQNLRHFLKVGILANDIEFVSAIIRHTHWIPFDEINDYLSFAYDCGNLDIYELIRYYKKRPGEVTLWES